ncbi:Heat shock 83-1 [Micractinium conductrix]|uniref:Heat shock 83-1 n=1 Tax=Micractinium conductrix TaxID=554055 RepID=A0A2P6VK56_9CHLO|nr:Heat shock 83-1 [Micractinium conductrix]|eukprot:PSC74482.1 Heat shock 83-1 [Micractinium conductrix]
MRLRPWQIALAICSAWLLLGVSPAVVYHTTLALLGSSCSRLWLTVRALPGAAPQPPLKQAILNVTSDFDQLSTLLVEFLQQPGVDPSIEPRLMSFLEARAAKSYPRLESLLDWLLAIYKFLFPFLVISLVARLQGGGSDDQGAAAAEEEPRFEPRSSVEQAAMLNSQLSRQLSRRSSQQQQQRALVPAMLNGASPFDRQPSLALSQGQVGSGGDHRAGSHSPPGPETPIEGARMLPPHPASLQPAVPAARTPRAPPQRTISEISVEGF